MSTEKMIQETDAVLELTDNVIAALGRVSSLAAHDMILDYYCDCVAKNIPQVRNGFYKALSECIESMTTDWTAIRGSLFDHTMFDADVASQMKTKGAAGVSTGMAPHHIRNNRTTGNTFSIDPKKEFFHVKSNDLDGLDHSISNLEYMLINICSCRATMKMFVSTSAYQGDCATAIKEYISNAHMPILSKFEDLTYSLINIIKSYISDYDSLYTNNKFDVDEEELQDFISSIEIRGQVLDEEVYEANGIIKRINAESHGFANVLYIGSDLEDAVGQVKASFEREMTDIRNIETSGYSELSSYVTAVNEVFRYTELLKINSESGLLNTDTAILGEISSKINTGYKSDVLSRLEIYLHKNKGTIDDTIKGLMLEYLEDDPKYAERSSDIINYSDEILGRMFSLFEAAKRADKDNGTAISYALDMMLREDFAGLSVDKFGGILMYINSRISIDKNTDINDAAETAFSIANTKEDWIDTLYRQVCDGNAFLSDPSHFVVSAEHRPKETIEAALEWAKAIAKNENYGYNTLSHYGEFNSFDCATYAACAFAMGAGMPIPLEYGDKYNIRASTILERLEPYGFVRVEFDGNCQHFEPGDILVLNPNDPSHVQFFYHDGITLHATKWPDSYDESEGDQQYTMLEALRGEEKKYGMDDWEQIFTDYYGDEIPKNGFKDSEELPYVGEIAACRIASNEKPEEYLAAHTTSQIAYIIRYTAGVQ